MIVFALCYKLAAVCFCGLCCSLVVSVITGLDVLVVLVADLLVFGFLGFGGSVLPASHRQLMCGNRWRNSRTMSYRSFTIIFLAVNPVLESVLLHEDVNGFFACHPFRLVLVCQSVHEFVSLSVR